MIGAIAIRLALLTLAVLAYRADRRRSAVRVLAGAQ